MALTDGTRISLANAGDARAVLCERGEAFALTRDHTPAVYSEAQRVIKVRGLPHAWRMLRSKVSTMLQDFSHATARLRRVMMGIMHLPVSGLVQQLSANARTPCHRPPTGTLRCHRWA